MPKPMHPGSRCWMSSPDGPMSSRRREGPHSRGKRRHRASGAACRSPRPKGDRGMRKASAIIRIPAGRRTKWAVLVFWLIIVAVLGPLAGKLTGAGKNNASAWPPAAAGSHKVLDVQSRFQSPNIYAAVVVYARPSRLTSADKAKAQADALRFRGVANAVHGQVTAPVSSAPAKAPQTIFPANLRFKRWNRPSA